MARSITTLSSAAAAVEAAGGLTSGQADSLRVAKIMLRDASADMELGREADAQSRLEMVEVFLQDATAGELWLA